MAGALAPAPEYPCPACCCCCCCCRQETDKGVAGNLTKLAALVADRVPYRKRSLGGNPMGLPDKKEVLMVLRFLYHFGEWSNRACC